MLVHFFKKTKNYKFLKTLKNFVKAKNPTANICEALFGLLAGSVEEIPKDFLLEKVNLKRIFIFYIPT